MGRLTAARFLFAGLGAAACGGAHASRNVDAAADSADSAHSRESQDARPPDAARDATLDGTVDATPGAPDAAPDVARRADATYPAFGFEAPQVTDLGAPVLPRPLFLPVVFAGDSLAGPIEGFVSALGASDYWATVTTEYGVGRATAGAQVDEETAPGAQVSDGDVQAFLAEAIATDPRFRALGSSLDAATLAADAASSTAAPPAGVVYVLFYPEGTTVSVAALGTGCTDFGGYHSSFVLENGATVVYAVIPRCISFDGVAGVDFVTSSASHEMVEAATDPVPSNPAWQGTDVDHVVWKLVLGDAEVADMCAFLTNPDIRLSEPSLTGSLVQRIWSNRAAAAHEDPCVPTTGDGPYFNSVPMTTEVPFVDDGSSLQTLGAQIPVGTTSTLTLDLVSSGPTSSPWTVTVLDYGVAYGNPAILDLELVGATSGTNGQRLDLKVTPLSAAPAGLDGLSPYFIMSTEGDASTFWVGAVAN